MWTRTQLLAFAIIAITLVSGCTPSTAVGGGAKIGLVTALGDLQDRSYNQFSWQGTQDGAKAIGATAKVIVNKDVADIRQNIKQFVDQGYDIIITLGFLEGDETLKAAQANPKIQFFGSDQFVCVAKDASDKACGANPPNYQGLGFDEAQGGYLAGVVAGTITKSGTIGVVGGRSDIPGVQKFIKGYKNGAQSVRSGVRVLVDYTEDFGAPDKGEAVAKTMISQGADVMFHAAGGSGAGVLRAACNAKVWAIGGGQDEYVTVPDAQACIVTSAEQKFAASASSALARWKKSGMQSGNFVNSVSNDGMGLSQIRNLNPVPPELDRAVAKAMDDLKSGRVDPGK